MNIKSKLITTAILAAAIGWIGGASSSDDNFSDCHAATVDYSNAIIQNDGTQQRTQTQKEAFELYKMQCLKK